MLDAHSSFFYLAMMDRPAMVMRLSHIGLQYFGTFYDARTRPAPSAGVPAGKFWSVTVYDSQARSMMATAQRFPHAGGQSFPSPAATADADGSTTIQFGPTCPEGLAAR